MQGYLTEVIRNIGRTIGGRNLGFRGGRWGRVGNHGLLASLLAIALLGSSTQAQSLGPVQIIPIAKVREPYWNPAENGVSVP
ncbi:MAG: hypothetical protein ACYDC1_24375 [Limisphaerales bacterium]